MNGEKDVVRVDWRNLSYELERASKSKEDVKFDIQIQGQEEIHAFVYGALDHQNESALSQIVEQSKISKLDLCRVIAVEVGADDFSKSMLTKYMSELSKEEKQELQQNIRSGTVTFAKPIGALRKRTLDINKEHLSSMQNDMRAELILDAMERGENIGGRHPLMDAAINGIKIEGQDPILYAVEKGITFGSISPILRAKMGGVNIEGQDPVLYAIANNIVAKDINGQETDFISLVTQYPNNYDLKSLSTENATKIMVQLAERYNNPAHKLNQSNIESLYNILQKQINPNAKQVTLEQTGFDKADSNSIANKLCDFVSNDPKSSAVLNIDALKVCNIELVSKMLDIGKEMQQMMESDKGILDIILEAISEFIAKVTGQEVFTAENLQSGLEIIALTANIAQTQEQNANLQADPQAIQNAANLQKGDGIGR